MKFFDMSCILIVLIVIGFSYVRNIFRLFLGVLLTITFRNLFLVFFVESCTVYEIFLTKLVWKRFFILLFLLV